jgi:hypothetical protein
MTWVADATFAFQSAKTGLKNEEEEEAAAAAATDDDDTKEE